jgi:pSer/pThr/pTyr-binding forkhead associated (FHA) protein
MPRFTISREGQTLNQLDLRDERIEMGSANTCKVFIDDLLVSLHQAAFVKTEAGYDIEPLARTPAMTLNGAKVEKRTPLPAEAAIEVEGYEIRVVTESRASASQPPSAAAPAPVKPLSDLPPPMPPPPPPPPPQPPQQSPPPPPLPKPDTLEGAPAAPVKSTETAGQGSPPPLPPLPPLPDPVSEEKSPGPPPVESGSPPPLPPLPQPDTGNRDTGGEAPTVYVSVHPVGQLVTVSGPLQGKTWPMMPGEIKIGRDQAKNDIVIRLDSSGELDTSVSRRHASILIEGETAYLVDQNSAAGTFINGHRANPGERIPLRSGDEVEIRSAKVSTVLRVELEGDASAPGPPPPPLPQSASQPPAAAPYQPPPPPPPPRHQPPSQPERAPERARGRAEAEQPAGERRSRRRRERAAPRVDDSNPFLPGKKQGMPQWVWFAIAGAVVVIVLVVVFLLT